MESAIGPLLPLFERERAAGKALALGVLLHTEGSTYRKRGALILIAADGEYAGLVSGGCLEGDLSHYAREVIESGEARIVSYDLRHAADELWGLGLGCEGAMRILLLRLDRDNNWQPLAHFSRALVDYQPASAEIVVESVPGGPPLGSITFSTALESNNTAAHLFVLRLALPPRILLLGAGPDAAPVVEFAARLGWQVTVMDHRSSYARPEKFPQAARVIPARAEDLAHTLDLKNFAAAVVMSHHLGSDRAYLSALAQSPIGFVGLLGPPVRRARLLAELGPLAASLQNRLRAPVGLALGGRAPESIALAIVAELHAFLHG